MVLAILAVGLAIRLLYFNSIAGSAFIDFPLFAERTDLHSFWAWSGEILGGNWLGQPAWHPMHEWMLTVGSPADWHRWWGGAGTFQQEPLYPYLLAMLRFIGLPLGGIILFQLVIGSAQILLTFLLTRRLFKDARPALIAAALAAVYGPLLFNQGALLRDWLGPLLETGALALMLRAATTEKIRDWAVAGLVLGLALLVRSAVIAFIPLAVLWLVWAFRGEGRVTIRRAVALVAGIGVGFAPLVLRNLAVGVSPFRITNRLPEALANGNALDTDPLGVFFPNSLPAVLEEAGGSSVKAGLAILRGYEGDWVAFLALQWQKFRGLVDPVEIPDNLSYAYAEVTFPILSWLPDFGWLLVPALAGLAALVTQQRLDRGHHLVLLHAATVLVALLATSVVGRYRLALTPFLFVYAGAFPWLVVSWFRRRRYRALLSATVGVLAGLGLQHQLMAVESLRQDPVIVLHPGSYQLASRYYAERGRGDLALAEWSRLRSQAERNDMPRIQDLAAWREQEILLQQVAAAHNAGMNWRAPLDRLSRRYDDRLDGSIRHLDVGLLLHHLGEAAAARQHLERFVTDNPDHPRKEDACEVLRGGPDIPRPCDNDDSP